MLKEKDDAVVHAKRVLVIGTRPKHKHQCGCECNSPYCDEPLNVDCENHGGPPSIMQGQEPWRGR